MIVRFRRQINNCCGDFVVLDIQDCDCPQGSPAHGDDRDTWDCRGSRTARRPLRSTISSCVSPKTTTSTSPPNFLCSSAFRPDSGQTSPVPSGVVAIDGVGHCMSCTMPIRTPATSTMRETLASRSPGSTGSLVPAHRQHRRQFLEVVQYSDAFQVAAVEQQVAALERLKHRRRQVPPTARGMGIGDNPDLHRINLCLARGASASSVCPAWCPGRNRGGRPPAAYRPRCSGTVPSCPDIRGVFQSR